MKAYTIYVACFLANAAMWLEVSAVVIAGIVVTHKLTPIWALLIPLFGGYGLKFPKNKESAGDGE